MGCKEANNNVETDNIIFFDGVCNLCNWAVDFIIRHDKTRIFKYSALQSEFANEFLTNFGISIEDPPASIYLYRNGTFLSKSSAVGVILRSMPFPWKAIGGIIKFVPELVTDGCYNIIAKNRYHWMGKRNTCRVPGEEEKSLFIS